MLPDIHNLLVKFLLFLAHFFHLQFSYWRYIFGYSTCINNVPCNYGEEIVWNKEPESQAERAGCMTWRESLILQDLFPHSAARGSVWLSAEAPCSSDAPWLLAVSAISNWTYLFQSHTRGRAGPSQDLGRPVRTRAGLSLWGLEEGSSWSNTNRFLPVQKRTIQLFPGDPLRILTVWGLSCDGNGGLL